MNGIINFKKEVGMTSHDAVFKLRKILGTKRLVMVGPWIRCGGCFAHCGWKGDSHGRVYAGRGQGL